MRSPRPVLSDAEGKLTCGSEQHLPVVTKPGRTAEDQNSTPGVAGQPSTRVWQWQSGSFTPLTNGPRHARNTVRIYCPKAVREDARYSLFDTDYNLVGFRPGRIAARFPTSLVSGQIILI